MDMLLILVIGIAIGWLTTLSDKIPTAKDLEAWIRERLAGR